MNESKISHIADYSQASRDPIPGIIKAGSFNILAGASGVGKTCLLSTLLKSLEGGAAFLGVQTQAPVQIGYLCADRSAETAHYWLAKAGQPKITFYSLADDMLFQPSRLRNKGLLIAILGECLDRLALPVGALAIVDPVALFMGGNLNDYQSCAVACIEIRRECRRRRITIIGTAHASKQKADKKDRYQRLQDRINGSGAQLGYGDTQMYLASPEETGHPHYTFMWHPHTAPAQEFTIGRTPEGMFVPWGDTQQAAEENTVYGVIPEGLMCMPLVTIQQLCAPMSERTVFRRLQELLADGLIEKPIEGQYRRASKI